MNPGSRSVDQLPNDASPYFPGPHSGQSFNISPWVILIGFLLFFSLPCLFLSFRAWIVICSQPNPNSTEKKNKAKGLYSKPPQAQFLQRKLHGLTFQDRRRIEKKCPSFRGYAGRPDARDPKSATHAPWHTSSKSDLEKGTVQLTSLAPTIPLELSTKVHRHLGGPELRQATQKQCLNMQVIWFLKACISVRFKMPQVVVHMRLRLRLKFWLCHDFIPRFDSKIRRPRYRQPGSRNFHPRAEAST